MPSKPRGLFGIVSADAFSGDESSFAGEPTQIAAYSIMHVHSIFLLLIRVTASEAADLQEFLNDVQSPDRSIVHLGAYDALPLELCRQLGCVKCALSLEEAVQLALEPWPSETPGELTSETDNGDLKKARPE